MEASDLKRLKSLEEENAKLKRMYAELALDHELAKEIIAKKLLSLVKKEVSRVLFRLRHKQGVPCCRTATVNLLPSYPDQG